MLAFLFFYCGKLDWSWYNEKTTFALLHSAVYATEAVMYIVNAYLLKGCVCVWLRQQTALMWMIMVIKV